MKCQPQPTDAPGIFRCPVCGLQNPRPIKKPFHAQCGADELPRDIRPLIARLAAETSQPSIIEDMAPYQSAVLQWEAADFPIRKSDEIQFILDVVCPDCQHYQAESKTCGCYKAKGQLVAIKIWMASEFCPAGQW